MEPCEQENALYIKKVDRSKDTEMNVRQSYCGNNNDTPESDLNIGINEPWIKYKAKSSILCEKESYLASDTYKFTYFASDKTKEKKME